MIRQLEKEDLDEVMKIWLEANVEAHHFIEQSYWEDQFDMVKKLLPLATVYVYEKDETVQGFIGLNGPFVEGVFVDHEAQSKGIGKQLMDTAKSVQQRLTLQVYRQNQRAVDFYLREGFLIQSEQTDEATGETEYQMVWSV